MTKRISYNREEARRSEPSPLNSQTSSKMVLRGMSQRSGRSFSYQLLNISNQGAAFFVPGKTSVDGLIPGYQINNIIIEIKEKKLLSISWGKVLNTQPATHNGTKGYLIDIFFSNNYDDLVTEHITDARQIITLIREAMAINWLQVSVWDGNYGYVQVNGGKIDEKQFNFSINATDLNHLITGDVLEIVFDHDGAKYNFFGSVIAINQSDIILRIPKLLKKTNRRDMYRKPLSQGSNVFMTGKSPFGNTLKRRPVIEITGAGMSIPLNSQLEVLPPGTELEEIQVVFPGVETITFNGVVRTLTHLHDITLEGYTHKCSIQFSTMPLMQRLFLANTIVQGRLPQVEDANGEDFERVWNCLKEAGFLYPEKEEKLREVMPQLRNTITSLLSEPNQIAKNLLYKDNDEVVGYLSTLRIYSRTWLSHHLAVASQKFKGISAVRMLNLESLEYVEQIPEIEWVRVYFRPSNPWAQRVFGSLSKKLNHLPYSDIYLLDYLYSHAQEHESFVPSLTVRIAENKDLELIERYFVEHHPVALHTDDYLKERIRMDEISAIYRSIGLRREREVLIADRNGEPSAFALMEFSSIGINFSELTNAFRVYAFDDDNESKQALINAARNYYHQLGRKFVFALGDERDRHLFENCGFKQTKQYACWSWHRATYRAYYEHIVRITERR